MAAAPSVPGAEAVRAAQQRVRQSPQRPDAWLALGRAWGRVARETGDPGFTLAVEACAQEVLAREPESAQALGLLALALTSQHRFAEARDRARAALQSDPDDLVSLGALADALIELGDIDGAEGATQRMLDLKPSLPAYARAAHLRWLRGDSAGAKVLYRHAIDSGWDARDREPTAWALVQAAMVFWHGGDYEGAEAGCDLALRWLESYPAGLACKGRAALSAGRSAEAATLLARSLRAAPLVETAWLLANARREAGDEVGAAAADAEALRIGRATDGLQLAALLASRRLHLDEALRRLEVERKTRSGGALDDALAWALFRVGRIPEAEVAAERALRTGTRDARILYHGGAIALAAGRTEAGRALIADALALNPAFDTVEAREARELLRAQP
ncbi:MAG: hypothetical protein AMXMBFR64_23240 [Myxococcales bacterium]